MPEINLTAGPIEYTDTGGTGPTLVFLHGLLMDGTVWRHVVEDLQGEYRCVLPTLPLGGHRRPMEPGVDLSGRGQARLLAQFMDELDLREVTLVANDWGGAQLLVSEGLHTRVARMVLTSQEAYENFPPGIPGRAIWLASRLPGGIAAAVKPLRFGFLRKLPLAFGWMSRRGVPREVMDAWLDPIMKDRAIRRDLRKYLTQSPKGDYAKAGEDLGNFTRPVLVAWSANDRIMPPEHGRRMAEALPDSRYVEIDDSYTLVCEDQPEALCREIRAFLADTTATAG